MKEVSRLTWFEWKQMDVVSFLTGILICVCFAVFFQIHVGAEGGMNWAKGLLDFLFLVTTTTWLGVMHVRGFGLRELSAVTWASPFYMYTRRFPLSEKQLFRSRVLLKGIQAPFLIIISICLMVLVQNVLPFSFSDLSFYSFLSLWAAIAFVTTSTALDEMGVRYQKRMHLYGLAYVYFFIFLLVYVIVWVWLIPFDDSFMAFTVYLATDFPYLSFLIATFGVLITLFFVLRMGDKRIERKGDGREAAD